MHKKIPTPPSPTSAPSRAARTLRWLMPGVILAVIPKCPACLAAYIALGTGVAVSLPVAEALRLGSLVICAGALAWLATRKLWRLRSRVSPGP